MTFVLAMIQFPEVQRRAQEEIDTIIGNDRLPDFGDRDDLPYVSALVKEVHRWQPVGPVGEHDCASTFTGVVMIVFFSYPPSGNGGRLL